MANIAMSPESLAHHLRVAADKYTNNAAGFNGSPEGSTNYRLCEQFQRQAAECIKFADALESELRAIGFDSQDRIELELVDYA